MKYKKIMFMLVLTIFIFSMTSICATDVNDTWIASEDDSTIELSQPDATDVSARENDEIISEGNTGTFSELQGNITAATNGSTLILTKDYEHEADFDSKGIIINQSITIDGQGHKIDAQGKSRIFKITADNVILKNINFINGNTTMEGGAVHFEKSGTVSDCNFTNNKAMNIAAFGGAISMDSGSVTNCNFVNNYAYNNGGAVHFMNDVNMSNCNFTGNTAMNGGAAYFNSYSYITIADCNFINNTATGDGGAILMDSGSLKYCNFANNTANNGSAIYFYVGGNLTDCNFTKNKATEYGGAIFTVDYINMLNSLFDNNIANKTGGAVYIDNNCSNSKISSTFINNSAYNGGAIYFNGKVNNTTINSLFKDNNAKRSGGAIFVRGQSLNNKFSSEFYENKAINASGGAILFRNLVENNIFESIFTDNYALYGGAIMFLYKANNNKFDSNFKFNVAKSCGGAMFFYNTTNNNNFTGCFVNNSALGEVDVINGNGGAITFKDVSTNCMFTCDFINNTAALNGGGVNYRQTPHNITFNSNFINNTSPSGGGVNFFENFDNVIFNGEFDGNSAEYGGAIAAAAGIIKNVSFKDNYAEFGGAVYFSNNGEVTNCNFTDNKATYGGAVYFSNNSEVTNCNFTGNNATTGSAIYFYDNTSATKTVSNSLFLNNRANAEELQITKNENNITITFTGNDNLLNAIYSNGDVSFTNVTYWGANGINNTGNSEIKPSRSKNEAGQNITVTALVNGEIVLNDVKVTDENGMIVLDMNAGENYYIGARHDTDSYYTEAEESISNMAFNVNVTSQTTNNKTVNITAKSDIYSEFMIGKLLFVLPNGTEINATYAVNGTWWAEYTFKDYDIYQVSAYYDELDNVIVSNGTINITRADSTITLDDIVMNYGKSINVTVTTTGAEGITAKIDGKDVEVNNFTIPISGLDVGNHTLTVTTIADGDHNPVNKTVTVTVNEHAVVSAPDVTKYYKGNEKFVVTVTDSKNNPLANQSVIISINGVNYTRTTDANGTASIAIGLVSGQYNITTIVDNDTIYSTVTVLPTVNATDLVKVFRNGTQFYATFKDSQGNYLADGTMARFNIYGVMYDREVSGDKGLVRLDIDFEPGEYIITSMNLKTGETTSNNVTVISRIIENEDLTKYYRNATQYTVKVIDDTGKAVGAGEIVTFNINGVLYNRTTNASGIAKLNINLNPGDYIITAQCNGCEVSNKIKVLPVLSADDLNKKYGAPDQFIAKLLDGTGKVLSGETVQFNVNGIFYNRVTDSNGQAKLNIRLMPGKHIITSSYNGTSIANNITVYA